MINIITLCSGYDSQCLALKHSNIPFNLVAWSEFDPESKKPLDKQPAVIAHNILFPEFKDRNVGDMTEVDWNLYKNEDIDLLTYSTPCQSLSAAGSQTGIEKDSGTKSSILWYTENAISILRPKYLLQENVKALVSEKFKDSFDEWCRTVEKYGYRNYWTVLNAKDFGIPQSRERLFMVSVRDDIDTGFVFSDGNILNCSLLDFLDKEPVNNKYFYSKERVQDYRQRISSEKTKDLRSLDPLKSDLDSEMPVSNVLF